MRIGSLMIVAWGVLGGACSDVNSGTKVGDSAEASEVVEETAVVPEVAEETAEVGVEVTPEVVDEVDVAVEVGDEVGLEVVETVDAGAETDADEVVEVERCGCGFGQECAAPCLTEGTVCVRDLENDSRTCEPPAQLGRTCGNFDNAFSHPCEPGLTCAFPMPDDADSAKLCYDCRPQDFTIVGECEAEIGVFWDGADCAMYSGCSCEGAACATPFESVAECRRKTQTPCAPEQ